jgi:hypothetical protein
MKKGVKDPVGEEVQKVNKRMSEIGMMEEEGTFKLSYYEFNMIKDQIEKDRNSIFTRAMNHYLRGDFAGALQIFQIGFSREMVLDLTAIDPFLVSQYGILMAVVEKKFSDAKQLADISRISGGSIPEVILNRGRIYELCGETASALDCYRTGYRTFPDNVEFLRRLQRLNPRRKKPIPFLSRGHFVNRMIGKVFTCALAVRDSVHGRVAVSRFN